MAWRLSHVSWSFQPRSPLIWPLPCVAAGPARPARRPGQPRLLPIQPLPLAAAELLEPALDRGIQLVLHLLQAILDTELAIEHLIDQRVHDRSPARGVAGDVEPGERLRYLEHIAQQRAVLGTELRLVIDLLGAIETGRKELGPRDDVLAIFRANELLPLPHPVLHLARPGHSNAGHLIGAAVLVR